MVTRKTRTRIHPPAATLPKPSQSAVKDSQAVAAAEQLGSQTLAAQHKAKEAKQKQEARDAVVRAQKHLKDYATHLRNEEMLAMAEEIDQIRDDLDKAPLMLGFSVQKAYSFTGGWSRA